MKRASLAVSFLALVGAIAAVPAFADSTIYTNGPGNYGINAWNVSNGFTVSDSFTLGANSTITGATFDVWAFFRGLPYGRELVDRDRRL
jgi:hypothetical protein